MTLESLKEEIMNEAKKSAALVVNSAQKEASGILAEAAKKKESRRDSLQEETKRILAAISKKEKSRKELELKRALLEAKKRIVENAFSSALKNLQSGSKKRSEILNNLIRMAEKDIQIDKISCRKEDISLVKKYPALPANISGGIIAENKDRTLVVDLSFESLFASLRQKELHKVHKILFGE